VEAGANDGEYLSNTLRLEKEMGWTGILIEPDSGAFEALKRKRRRSWISNICLSTSIFPEKVKNISLKYLYKSKSLCLLLNIKLR